MTKAAAPRPITARLPGLENHVLTPVAGLTVTGVVWLTGAAVAVDVGVLVAAMIVPAVEPSVEIRLPRLLKLKPVLAVDIVVILILKKACPDLSGNTINR